MNLSGNLSIDGHVVPLLTLDFEPPIIILYWDHIRQPSGSEIEAMVSGLSRSLWDQYELIEGHDYQICISSRLTEFSLE